MNLPGVIKNLTRIVGDNSPAILTALGASGVIGTAILATKAGYKAGQVIFEESSERDEVLSIKEQFGMTWRFYIPAAIVGGLTVAAVIGAHSITSRRHAAVLSAFSMTETAFREYREKVVEQIGINKDQKIRDEVAADHIRDNPISSSQVIVTGTGEHLCFDSLSGRYFTGDIEKVRRAQNDINAQCLNEMYASHNDFYRLIGLPPNVYGEELGWSFDHLMDIEFGSYLSEDNRPCLSLEYRVQPIRGYHKINR